MNSTTQHPNHDFEQQRQRLEALVHPNHHPESAESAWVRAFKTLGGGLVRFLTAQNELRIWQRTRHGRQTWFAYDPMTNKTRQFYSEHEVRLWLDTRYNE
ncbi:MAG: hypothetical protein HC922_01350 [Leptolyngbyaceae cyanobacterium SM2_3_12]|nr:hypothetical protein [Leptolyngbyaceae cyanobacterium SM2_3_12]